MQYLQKEAYKKTLFDWSIGGQGKVFEENVLRQVVSSHCADRAECNSQANDDVQGEKISGNVVPKLRRNKQASHSPSGPRYPEQQGGELDDTLRALSQQASRGANRVKSLGNAVVPQIPEMIGNAILQAEVAA